jgi:ribosomal protein S17
MFSSLVVVCKESKSVVILVEKEGPIILSKKIEKNRKKIEKIEFFYKYTLLLVD